MINPIPKSGLWNTPESLEQLDEMIAQLPTLQRALVYNHVMLTLNLCHKLVEDKNAVHNN
jgi:hypothetical protein